MIHGAYHVMMDVNERVREEWVDDTSPGERVCAVMRRMYETQSVSVIADRALVSKEMAREHLDRLVEDGFVDDVDGEYRRAPESFTRERVERILEDVDIEELEERVAELRQIEDADETTRRNLRFAERALEIEDGDGG